MGSFVEDWEKMDCMHFFFLQRDDKRAPGKLSQILFQTFMRPKYFSLYRHELEISRQLEAIFVEYRGFIRFALTDKKFPIP